MDENVPSLVHLRPPCASPYHASLPIPTIQHFSKAEMHTVDIGEEILYSVEQVEASYVYLQKKTELNEIS